MNTKKLKVIFAVCCLVSHNAFSDELANRARDIFKKYQPAVVTVQLVVKSKFSFGGFGGDARESKQEVTGTVIDPSGLTVLSLASTDPTTLLQGMMSGLGGDGE